MNTITITGRITTDPEMKHTQSGVSVCTYNLAVKRPKVKDVTDFLPVVSWRQGAEYICKYAHKGDIIAVTGTLTTRKWQDKDGNNRISYEVVTDTVEIISSPQNNPNGNNAKPQQSSKQQDYIDIVGDEELPF